MGRSFVAIIALSLVGALVPQSAAAQVEFTDSTRMVGTSFNGFNGSGFAPTPSAGQLDSDEWIVLGMSAGALAFGGTGTTNDYARGASNGGVTTGGVYAFNVGTSAGSVNPALGAQSTAADFTPGAFAFRITNNGTTAISSVTLNFMIYILNNGNRSTRVRLGHSIDGGTRVDSGFMRMTAGAASTPAAWAGTSVTRVLAAAIPVGSTVEVFFLFTDPPGGGAGSRDEIAIDDVQVVAPGLSGTDAGVDAGPSDAGSDAGFDAGTTDAGTTDAGATDAGTTDAGAPVDAGPDASTATDAGDTLDSGIAIDAGDTTDAGTTPSDGGDEDGGGMSADSGIDAGVGTMEMDSGCGCSVPGRDRDFGAPLALLGLLGVVVWRRRRRR